MKKVFNNIIPFKGFLAMCLWPFIFIRKKAAWRFDDKAENHENIHGQQQVEMLVVGIILAVGLAIAGCAWWSLLALPLFLWWYGIEWLVRWCILRDANRAYRAIAFEQEAYANEGDMQYLASRRRFAWIAYIGRRG